MLFFRYSERIELNHCVNVFLLIINEKQQGKSNTNSRDGSWKWKYADSHCAQFHEMAPQCTEPLFLCVERFSPFHEVAPECAYVNLAISYYMRVSCAHVKRSVPHSKARANSVLQCSMHTYHFAVIPNDFPLFIFQLYICLMIYLKLIALVIKMKNKLCSP